jgi:predicted lipoprotein with Yx(FWY)xxD motif
VIIAVAALALVLAGCGSSAKYATTTKPGSGATTTTASSGYGGGYGGGTKTTTTPTTASTGGSSGTVKTASNSKAGGTLLVDSAGRTLYMFEKDSGTTSACNADPCMSAWPAFTSSSTPSDGSGATAKIGTATGQVANQVTYNGHLLYYFSGDTAAGQANGLGIPSWYPVTPAGNKLDKS